MDRIDTLITPALRRMGVESGVRRARLETALASAVGETLAPLCSVVRVHRGLVVIGTAHPALAHQLHADSAALVLSLNRRLGENLVQRLRFVAVSPPATRGTLS